MWYPPSAAPLLERSGFLQFLEDTRVYGLILHPTIQKTINTRLIDPDTLRQRLVSLETGTVAGDLRDEIACRVENTQYASSVDRLVSIIEALRQQHIWTHWAEWVFQNNPMDVAIQMLRRVVLGKGKAQRTLLSVVRHRVYVYLLFSVSPSLHRLFRSN